MKRQLNFPHPPVEMTQQECDVVTAELFSYSGCTIWKKLHARPICEITSEEISSAAMKIKSCRAPGPHGVSQNAIKLVVKKRPDMFVDVFTAL